MDDTMIERTVLGRVVDTALVPLHAAVSKPAQRAYLGTFLFAAASILLFGISSLAYISFYYNYVPQNSVERMIHLQFGSGDPHGTTTLSSTLTSLQPYDITLFLHLPRTPHNLATGNFMLDLSLLAPDSTTPSSDMINSSLYGNTSAPILARSRRPAILTYASPVVDAASTLSGLPWYIMGWKQESEILKVSMLEGVEFAKGWTNVPQSVKVVVEAEEKMQFYEVGVRIVAKLGGLRWLLYHHRILSFLLFTSMFWASSMISMSFAWFVISSYFAEATPATKTKSDTNGSVIKQEPSDSEAFDPYSFEDLSDTSRTFPSLGRQMPLHYSGRKDLKEGDDSVKLEEEDSVKSSRIQPLGAEADDEEECMSPETSGWRDSGIGTGLDEERFASVQRRRKASMDGV